MLAAALTAAPASATSLSQKKAEAAAAEKQLTKLSNEAEHAVEVYDGVHQKYENTLAALRLNQQTLRYAKQNLKAAQQQLAASLTQDYKSGDQDAIAYVLAARSIGDLVDQVQVLQRTTGVNKNLLQQITKDQAEIVQREKLLKKQKAQLKTQQAAAASQRDRAKSAVARQMKLTPQPMTKVRNRMMPGKGQPAIVRIISPASMCIYRTSLLEVCGCR